MLEEGRSAVGGVGLEEEDIAGAVEKFPILRRGPELLLLRNLSTALLVVDWIFGTEVVANATV